MMVGSPAPASSKNAERIVGAVVQLSDTQLRNDTDQLSADLALFLANPSLKAALADGSLDLSQYSDTVNAELAHLEKNCIAVYTSKSKEIKSLAADLTACENVLSQLHEMLLGFQADLGGLSGEIRGLQIRSRTLDVQLKNRRAAESKIRHFLEHCVVSPAVAQAILSGPVQGTTFLQAVVEVDNLYQNCCEGTDSSEWSGKINVTETVAGAEMAQELNVLRKVAMKRSRSYFLTQMTLLRRPQTNIRVLQVHGLTKYAALADFLDPPLRQELFNVYCESMSATLQSLFRTYSNQLLLVDATVLVTRHDVICMDEAVMRDALTSRAKKRVDICSLGTRLSDCLVHNDSTQTNTQPIAAHVALLQKETYHYERLFSSWVGHLCDAVTNEHVFCRQFFKRDAFQQLFGGTIGLLTEQLENYLFTCNDAICLLLMIKVTHQYRRTAKKRKIHSLDPFFEKATILLWPRLKTVMEGHLRSIQVADGSKLGSIDLHAHYVSRRFGEFSCSLLLVLHEDSNNIKRKDTTSVNSPSPNKYFVSKDRAAVADDKQTAGGKLLEDLSDMVDAFVLLLERLAEEHTTQKKRTVFLINNIDHIACIFQERRVTGPHCSKFLELLLKYREVFVEEELLSSFSKMIAFVQQTEQHIAAASARKDQLDVNTAVVENLVMEFASNWKSSIEQINRNVLSYFSNFRNGMEILKHCLTQLLLYYTRLQDVIRKVWKNKPPAFCKDLVSTTVILSEIKKYALSI